jgi:hypothetical protein
VKWERSSGFVCSSETGAVAQGRITIWQWNASESPLCVELLRDERWSSFVALCLLYISPLSEHWRIKVRIPST